MYPTSRAGRCITQHCSLLHWEPAQGLPAHQLCAGLGGGREWAENGKDSDRAALWSAGGTRQVTRGCLAVLQLYPMSCCSPPVSMFHSLPNPLIYFPAPVSLFPGLTTPWPLSELHIWVCFLMGTIAASSLYLSKAQRPPNSACAHVSGEGTQVKLQQ